METLKDRVKTLRKKAGLSQPTLASMAKVSTQTIKDIEAGRTDGGMKSLGSIARALGISMEQLKGEAAVDIVRPKTFAETIPPGKLLSLLDKKISSIPPRVFELAEKLGADHETWASHIIPWLEGEVTHMEEQESRPPSSSSSS